MTQYPKRLIEVDLPIKRISAHARRENFTRWKAIVQKAQGSRLNAKTGRSETLAFSLQPLAFNLLNSEKNRRNIGLNSGMRPLDREKPEATSRRNANHAQDAVAKEFANTGSQSQTVSTS